MTFQDGDSITFVIPMPASWSAKKRARMDGELHRQKPDLDNLIGGAWDAAMPDGDAHIAVLGSCRKMWGEHGAILVTRENSTAHA